MTAAPASAESKTIKTQTSLTQYSKQTLTQTGVGKVQIQQNQQIDTIAPQPMVDLELPRGGMDITIMRSTNHNLDRAAQRRSDRRQRILEQRSMLEMPNPTVTYPYYSR